MVEAIPETASDSDVPSCEELARLAEARSRVYGFLAAAYNLRPDERLTEALLGSEIMALLDSIDEVDNLHQDVREGLQLIRRYAFEAQGKPADEVLTELGVERTRLLRGVKPGYSPPPPYESVYRAPEALGSQGASAEMAPQVTLDVRNAYATAGLVLAPEVSDQPDFIGFELEFMRHLTERESRSWTEGDRKEALKALEQQHAFLEGHLLHWVPRFCEVMAQAARLDFYQGIARMTSGFLVQEEHLLELVYRPRADEGQEGEEG